MIAGGFLGRSKQEQVELQPSPEALLVEELGALGEDARGVGLNQWREFFRLRDDIVHVHHMSKMAVLAALVSGRFVFTHHSGLYAARGVRRFAEQLVWRRASCVVCLSESEECEKQKRYSFLRGRTVVIPNGVRSVTRCTRARSWDGESEFVIAQVGQLIPLKRVELGLEALVHLPCNFVLELTYHNDALEGELRRLAEQLGVSGRVRFLGAAHGEGLATRYERASLLLLTSETESLPSVISEALMAGLPVVATAVGGVQEQVSEGGICVPLAGGSYAEAILKVAAEYDRYASSAFERGRVISQWTSRSMAKAHVRLYKRLLER